MASRDGATVAGTDGSDFNHRESIASQYKVSSEEVIEEEVGVAEDGSVPIVEADLPLAGDYHGIGGPSTVPLESEGAFEKPEIPHYNFLTDLFMSPSDDAIKSFQITERKRLIAQNKAYLSYALNFHLLTTLCLLAKLSPAILDRMDIFILPLEELNIPKPLLWEWLWLASCFLIYGIGSSAIKASKVDKMNIFLIVVLVALLVLLWGLGLHFSDAYAYMYEPHNKIYPTWKGYPVAMLWYIFGIVAINIHLFEMYFGSVLKGAWSLKRKSN